MKTSPTLKVATIALCAFAFGSSAQAAKRAEAKVELPPHITIQQTDLGAVFADENGMTLYRLIGDVGDGGGGVGG